MNILFVIDRWIKNRDLSDSSSCNWDT